MYKWLNCGAGCKVCPGSGGFFKTSIMEPAEYINPVRQALQNDARKSFPDEAAL
jgi:hypothetical protein